MSKLDETIAGLKFDEKGLIPAFIVDAESKPLIKEGLASAVASGNDTAVSVPMAVAAGLGEMGLSRMLITPKLGPCLRLCKVFTDMPLATGAPADLGVRKVCEGCGRCVEQCPGEAIPVDWPDPTAPAVDGKKCRDFWRRNGNSCANCLAVCPFMKS